MIVVHDIDDTSFNNFKPSVEMHQSVISSNRTLNNSTNSTSSYLETQLFQSSYTPTSLQNPIDQKIENLCARKSTLLKKRNKTFNSFLFRFFSIGHKKILTFDKELDSIERGVISLKRPTFQSRIAQTTALLRKTNANILMYKSEIQSTDNGPIKT